VGQTTDDLLLAQLARDAPPFLRSPLGVVESEGRVRRWLATRQKGFLFVVERAIYGRPRGGIAYVTRAKVGACTRVRIRIRVHAPGVVSQLSFRVNRREPQLDPPFGRANVDARPTDQRLSIGPVSVRVLPSGRLPRWALKDC